MNAIRLGKEIRMCSLCYKCPADFLFTDANWKIPLAACSTCVTGMFEAMGEVLGFQEAINVGEEDLGGAIPEREDESDEEEKTE